MKDKLEKIGITGKFFYKIDAVYKAPNNSLLYKNKVAEPLYTTFGIKQGDILSSMFFNLFINDLSSLLADTGNNEKSKLEDANISSVLLRTI